MSKEIPCPKCGHVWLWADWKNDKDAFCPKNHGCASEDKITMSDDLVKRLREDQPVTQDMVSTAQCALQDTAAARIEELEAKLAQAVGERDEALNQLDGARHSVDVLEKRVAELNGEVDE